MAVRRTGLPRQRDGITCGPSVAVMAGALLQQNPSSVVPQAWFEREQVRVHRVVNVVWPRDLGTTPAGMARAINEHSLPLGVRYRWRVGNGGRVLAAVHKALAARWPVAMLVGSVVPRHWVLLTELDGATISCYEPSSGRLLSLPNADIGHGRIAGIGFPRPFAFVLPSANVESRI